MNVLKQVNQAYQNVFKRDRLKVVTKMDQRKMDVLEKMVITNLVEEDDDGDYCITTQERKLIFM